MRGVKGADFPGFRPEAVKCCRYRASPRRLEGLRGSKGLSTRGIAPVERYLVRIGGTEQKLSIDKATPSRVDRRSSQTRAVDRNLSAVLALRAERERGLITRTGFLGREVRAVCSLDAGAHEHGVEHPG
jgi:hypothetical protein